MISVDGCTINVYGNDWYHLSDGYWIYEGEIELYDESIVDDVTVQDDFISSEDYLIADYVFAYKDIFLFETYNYAGTFITELSEYDEILYSKMRLQNVRHLNDPTEGCILHEFLDLKGELENRLHNYFQNTGEMEKSSMYLGCFTSRTDQLNMWTRYGNQGSGCCIEIDALSFDKPTAKELLEMNIEEDDNRYTLENVKYPLYAMLYCIFLRKYNSEKVVIHGKWIKVNKLCTK